MRGLLISGISLPRSTWYTTTKPSATTKIMLTSTEIPGKVLTIVLRWTFIALAWLNLTANRKNLNGYAKVQRVNRKSA